MALCHHKSVGQKKMFDAYLKRELCRANVRSDESIYTEIIITIRCDVYNNQYGFNKNMRSDVNVKASTLFQREDYVSSTPADLYKGIISTSQGELKQAEANRKIHSIATSSD